MGCKVSGNLVINTFRRERFSFLNVEEKKPAKASIGNLEKNLGESPAMASILILRPLTVIYMVSLLMNAVSCIPSTEFDSMLESLRERGYDLFCNAIVTSDLQFDIFAYQNQRGKEEEEEEEEQEGNTNTTRTNTNPRNTFTFFAPTDASLFALDMTQTASIYTDTLRFHVVPRRLSVTELRHLPEGYALPTLLSKRRLEITRSPVSSAGISVGGVEIVFPGLFYSRYIAVHGLSGILSLRSNSVSGVSSVPPPPSPAVPHFQKREPVEVPPDASSAGFRWRNIPNRPDKRTILDPNSQQRPHPPVEVPAPAPNAVSRQAPPATSPVMGSFNAPAQAPEADWTVHRPFDSPASVNVASVMTPVFPGPMYADSEIYLAPEGLFPEPPIEAPSEAGEEASVSVMKPWGGELEGVIEMPKKTEALDESSSRNCDLEGIGFNDNDDHPRIMQCNAS
ncbi:hypothetical protein PIB30_012729 [Stylosanthes scabra]|uniref:FAS1 domain-containing protein n=1 Tax=Stylosanthes scabra TaxID=79078 RepID=A0ABU6R630_9FABA|nr:hypothetical protein [Stylosanthes scabra]